MAETPKSELSTYDAIYQKVNGPEALAHRNAAGEKLMKGDVAGVGAEFVKANIAAIEYGADATINEVKAIAKVATNLTTGGKGR